MENLDVKSADHFFYKAEIPRKNAKRIDNKDMMTSLDTRSSHPLDVMYGTQCTSTVLRKQHTLNPEP
jgi:hypothetical protein